jgi:polyisoprenoid-binding protein YceI
VRRAIKLLVGAVVVVVVFAAAFVAWWVFGDRAPAKPKLSADASAEAGGPATPDGAWHVKPGSQVYVGYRIKELFGDSTLKHDVVARTPAVTGRLRIANDRVTTAVVSGDVTKLTSDREARDSYIRDNGLDSYKFPTARFTLTTPIPLATPVKKGQEVNTQAHGTLLLHGVKRPVTFSVQARWDGPTIDVVGTAPIVLRDFGITPPHTVIADVDDHGSMELDLSFVPEAG